jgi:hypothetical protein
MRRRTRRIRRSVAGFSATLFAVAFMVLYVQLASGHDPALVADAKRARATSTLTASTKAAAAQVATTKAASTKESSTEPVSPKAASETSAASSEEAGKAASSVTTSQS